jgi:tryptophan halogenase
MPIPDSLTQRWQLYERTGRIFRDSDELFSESSWLAVFEGQGVKARGYDPVADTMAAQDVGRHLKEIAGVVASCAQSMPSHEAFIASHCAASLE